MSKNRRLTHTSTGFFLDGKGLFIFSGEMHHFRVHPELWRDRFIRMKRGFMNCVGAYFYWPIIEPEEDRFNFKDESDIERYFKIADQIGLFTIPRPGPYICSEIDAGGHPHWLFPKIIAPRSLDPEYIKYTERYYNAVNAILRNFDIENGTIGKSNIMYQIENELFAREVYGGNLEYLLKLRSFVIDRYGDSIPIVTNENRPSRNTPVFDTLDIYPDAWKTKGIIEKIRSLQSEQPGFPVIGMEIEGGWFSVFGKGSEETGLSSRGLFEAEWTEFFLKFLIGAGMSGLNMYMYHGGTNFDWRAARYITTSYDFQAPISEWGGLSERYFKTKLIGGFVRSFGGLLCRMGSNDDFIPNMPHGPGSVDPNKMPRIYALTRYIRWEPDSEYSGMESAFVFLFNESEIYRKIILNPAFKTQFPPDLLMEPIGLAPKSSKIIPINIPLDTLLINSAENGGYMSPIGPGTERMAGDVNTRGDVSNGRSPRYILEYSTIEPYLCVSRPLGTVLLLRGEPGESFVCSIKVDGVSEQISGIIQINEDLFWNIGGSLIVGAVNNKRAERTWMISTQMGDLPIVSNVYLLYTYKVRNSENIDPDAAPGDALAGITIDLQFHRELDDDQILVSLPWFVCPRKISINGKSVFLMYDGQNKVASFEYEPGYSIEGDFDINVGMVSESRNLLIGDIGWFYRKEKGELNYRPDNPEISGGGDSEPVWIPFKQGKSAEDHGLLSNGYTVYRGRLKVKNSLLNDVESGKKISLFIPLVIDNAVIFIDDRYVGYVEQHGEIDLTSFIKDNTDLFISHSSESTHSITIFVERMGYYNAGLHESSGLFFTPYFAVKTRSDPEVALNDWRLYVDPDIDILKVSDDLDKSPSVLLEDVDTDDWEELNFERSGHKGITWFHKMVVGVYKSRVNIPADWAGYTLFIEFGALKGRCRIYLNDKPIFKYSFRHDPTRTSLTESAAIPLPADFIKFGADNEITVVVFVEADGDGIHNPVWIRGIRGTNGEDWAVRQKLDGEIEKLPEATISDLEGSDDNWVKIFSINDLPPDIGGMIWVKTYLSHYTIDELWAPKYLDMEGIPGKVLIWWNGVLIGRYWDIGPQKKFYIPEPLIKSDNEITLLFIPLGKPLQPIRPIELRSYTICKKDLWKIEF